MTTILIIIFLYLIPGIISFYGIRADYRLEKSVGPLGIFIFLPVINFMTAFVAISVHFPEIHFPNIDIDGINKFLFEERMERKERK